MSHFDDTGDAVPEVQPIPGSGPTTMALVEQDLAVKFQAMAAVGTPERGLELLDKLSAHFGTQLDA